MMEYVITYISVYITFFGYLIMYKITTHDKLNLSIRNFLILFLVSLISVFIGYQNSIFINLLSSIIIIAIELKIFYKILIKKSIFYSIVFSVISLLSDALFSLILNNKYLLNIKMLYDNIYLRLLLMIPVILISLIACTVLKRHINAFFDKYFTKNRLNRFNLLLLLIVIISIIVIFSLNGYNKVDRIGHILIITFIFLLIILSIIILYLLYKEYQIDQVNKKIIDENIYIKKIAEQDEEFKHNIINNLLGIKTVANKKANVLIDALIADYQHDYENILNINDLPNGVQSIIYRKAYNIENLNLIVENLIKKELYEILNPKKYNHLCTCIGILFDNALEAVKYNEDKIIEINFYEDEKNLYITLKNSFSNVIDLENIGKHNYSTKIKGHGIGLNYMTKLKTLEIKNEIINNMFISKLIIKK